MNQEILYFYSTWPGRIIVYYCFKEKLSIFVMKNYHNNTHTPCVGLLIVSFYRGPISKIYFRDTSEKNLRYPFKVFKMGADLA